MEDALGILQFVLVLLVASIPVAMPAVFSITMALGALAQRQGRVTDHPGQRRWIAIVATGGPRSETEKLRQGRGQRPRRRLWSKRQLIRCRNVEGRLRGSLVIVLFQVSDLGIDEASRTHHLYLITSSVRTSNGLGTVGLNENFERRTDQFVATSDSGMLMPISSHG